MPNKEKIAFLKETFAESAIGVKGTSDIEKVFDLVQGFNASLDKLEFDIALARGLSYYTGCIFEVKINNVAIGSVSGGGRYDNLTASFGDKENLSGVGFSFGVDRIYDAMEELNLFPKNASASSKVLVCHFDDACLRYGLSILASLRKNNIAAQIYPELSKLKKQLDYANKKGIPFAIVIGSDEMNTGMLSVKDMEKGEQTKLSIHEVIEQLANNA